MFSWWSENLVDGDWVVMLNGDLWSWAHLMSKGIWFLEIRTYFLCPVVCCWYRFREVDFCPAVISRPT